MTDTNRSNHLLAHLWNTNRPLTMVGGLMLVALAASGVGLLVDPRTIGGDPAWLKPAKFAVSTALYAFTLAWIFRYLPAWPRTRTLVGWVTSVVFLLEVTIIDIQAWRGHTSHFNISSPLDAVLFSVMGAAILAQTIASIWVAVALWQQAIDNRAMGTALRAGMLITILGAASAGLMTTPTSAQMSDLQTTHRLTTSGAHTVGAPDGTPGLPGTGWSRQHGDLRIPHFVGLHAMQVLPLLALLLTGRLDQDRAVRVVRVAAVSYGALFVLLLTQALRGEGLLMPGAFTSSLWGLWTLTTLGAAAATGGRRLRHTLSGTVGA